MREVFGLWFLDFCKKIRKDEGITVGLKDQDVGDIGLD